jgi:hypothetical protein
MRLGSIIFVPGLRAGAGQAWTHEKLCWPRDLLPREVPNARIILYGYNEDALDFFASEKENPTFRCSLNLLSELSGLRREDAKVPPL